MSIEMRTREEFSKRSIRSFKKTFESENHFSVRFFSLRGTILWRPH